MGRASQYTTITGRPAQLERIAISFRMAGARINVYIYILYVYMSNRQNTPHRPVGPTRILKGFVSLAKREGDRPKAISTIHAPVLGMVLYGTCGIFQQVHTCLMPLGACGLQNQGIDQGGVFWSAGLRDTRVFG